MVPRSLVLSLTLLLLARAPAASAIDSQTAGDVVTGLVLIGAFAQTYNKDDPVGRRQWVVNTGTELAVNTALRGVFQETEYGTRPNGHKYGFPSGHVGFAMSQAAFLGERYGWEYGLPGYAACAYVAWTRVDSNHHYWRDIVAAALVSQGVAMLTVTPHEDLEVQPIFNPDLPDWIGMRLAARWG